MKMLIEYKVKFEKDGLLITQRIEQGDAISGVKPDAPVVQKTLGPTFQDSEATTASSSASGGSSASRDEGGDSASRDEGGTGALGSGPITIFGPFIFMRPPTPPPTHSHPKPEATDGK